MSSISSFIADFMLSAFCSRSEAMRSERGVEDALTEEDLSDCTLAPETCGGGGGLSLLLFSVLEGGFLPGVSSGKS